MMTERLAVTLPGLYGQDGRGIRAIAYAHYCSPYTGWEWFMTEYDPETGEAFGLVKGIEAELGYFNVREFEELNRSKGMEIVERDLHFEPCELTEVM